MVSTTTVVFTVAVTAWLSDVVGILVGIGALYVGLTQKDKISNAFSILLNYSLRTSLSDLKYLLQKLQEQSIVDNDVSKNVRSILSQVTGKINGNPTLQRCLGDKIIKKLRIMIDDLDNNRNVNETQKILLCSEIIEKLSSLEVETHSNSSKYHE